MGPHRRQLVAEDAIVALDVLHGREDVGDGRSQPASLLLKGGEGGGDGRTVGVASSAMASSNSSTQSLRFSNEVWRGEIVEVEVEAIGSNCGRVQNAVRILLSKSGDFLSLGRKGGSLDDTGIARVPAPFAAASRARLPDLLFLVNYLGCDEEIRLSLARIRWVAARGTLCWLSFCSVVTELRLVCAQSRFTDWLSLTIA